MERVDPAKIRPLLDKEDVMAGWLTTDWATSSAQLQAAIQVAANYVWPLIYDLEDARRELRAALQLNTQVQQPARQRLSIRGDTRVQADGSESSRG